MLIIPPNEKRDAYEQQNWVTLDIETLPAPRESVEQLSERQLRKMATSVGGTEPEEDDLVNSAHNNSSLNPAMAGLAVIAFEVSENLWRSLNVPKLMQHLILHECDSRVITLLDPDLDLDSRTLRSCDFNVVSGLGRASFEGLRLLDEIIRPVWGATLLTYNGRRFDLPLLAFHYARQQLRPSRSLAFNRYDLKTNLDLCEVFSFQGAGRLISMEEVSLGLGLPSPKEDLDGTKVGAAWRAGRYLDVARYCVGDVRRLNQLAGLTLPYWRL
jgi:hypothetical protein